ncbi:hypothetical protein DFJ74DRAFT_43996 [Hyaloraphidium curvatum]|nr:hypothetical protein DFJ74DRAFT_43996 [Hyaloraphidium curvatum]
MGMSSRHVTCHRMLRAPVAHIPSRFPRSSLLGGRFFAIKPVAVCPARNFRSRAAHALRHAPTMSDATPRQNQPATPKKIDDLYKLIDHLPYCMLTTRNEHGDLVSRAMQVQKRLAGADLWFIGNQETHKFDDILFDPHVNVSFFDKSSGEWVSVSGIAQIRNDEATKAAAWNPSIKLWFEQKDNVRDGSPSDPRLTVIAVEAHTVHYSIQDKSTPAVLFEYLKGAVTKQPAVPHNVRELDEEDLGAARRVGKI